MRAAFQLTDSVKLITLPNVGGHHPIHRGPKAERIEESPLFPALVIELGHFISSSLALRLGFIPSAPLVLRTSDSA